MKKRFKITITFEDGTSEHFIYASKKQAESRFETHSTDVANIEAQRLWTDNPVTAVTKDW